MFRKRFSVVQQIIVVLLSVSFIPSCTKDLDRTVVYDGVKVNLVQNQPATKSSLSNVEEDKVANVTIAVYEHTTGLLEAVRYYTDASSIEFSLVKGKSYDFFAFANLGDLSALIRESYVSTSLLHSFSKIFSSFSDVSTYGVPMASTEPVTMQTGVDNFVVISVERLVAKFVVTVDRSQLVSSSLVVKSLAIRQAALTVFPFAVASSRKTSNVSDGDYASEADIIALNNGKSAFFYIPENCQGVLLPGNDNPWNKIPTESSAQQSCTYLEMVCSYSMTDKVAENVTYRMYLGGDNVTDFNVERNTVYTLMIVPTDAGIDQSSWRLEPGDVVTWTHTLVLSPDSLSINIGETHDYTVLYYTYKHLNGVKIEEESTCEDVTATAVWSSGDTQILSVSDARVTALSCGETQVLAAYSGCNVFGVVKVLNPIEYVDELHVTGPDSLDVGLTGSYTATKQTWRYVNHVKDKSPVESVDVTASATWSSGNSGKATVFGGVVTGVSAGSVTITASYGELSDSKVVAVADHIEYVHSLSIAPTSASIRIGGTQAYTATYYTYRSTNGVVDWKHPTATESVTASYSSGDTSLASVSGVTATGVGEGSVTVTGEYLGVNSTATLSVSDGVSYYDTPVVSLSYGGTISAGGGSLSPSLSYRQTVHYLSGKTATLTTGGAVSYSGSATGFSVNVVSGVVTASANEGKGRSVGVTVSVTMNGKTGTGIATVSQNIDSVSSYGTPSVSVSYGGFGASGGTNYPTLSYSQTVYYVSGKTSTVTSGGSVSYSGSATGFSVNSSNGALTASANTGSARSVIVTARVTLNGKTGSGSATVSQYADSVVDYHYNDRLIAYGTPSVSIGSGITAAGGSAAISGSVSNTWRDQTRYASGRVVDNASRSVAGSVSFAEVSDPNSRYSVSGSTLYHVHMHKSVTTDAVTVRCYNAGNKAYYKDASVSVVNSYSDKWGSKQYGDPYFGDKSYGKVKDGTKSYGEVKNGTKSYGDIYNGTQTDKKYVGEKEYGGYSWGDWYNNGSVYDSGTATQISSESLGRSYGSLSKKTDVFVHANTVYMMTESYMSKSKFIEAVNCYIERKTYSLKPYEESTRYYYSQPRVEPIRRDQYRSWTRYNYNDWSYPRYRKWSMPRYRDYSMPRYRDYTVGRYRNWNRSGTRYYTSGDTDGLSESGSGEYLDTQSGTDYYDTLTGTDYYDTQTGSEYYDTKSGTSKGSAYDSGNDFVTYETSTRGSTARVYYVDKVTGSGTESVLKSTEVIRDVYKRSDEIGWTVKECQPLRSFRISGDYIYRNVLHGAAQVTLTYGTGSCNVAVHN